MHTGEPKPEKKKTLTFSHPKVAKVNTQQKFIKFSLLNADKQIRA